MAGMAVLFGAGVLAPACRAAGIGAKTSDDAHSGVLTMERSLPAGGTVALNVNVGNVKILANSVPGRVRLELRSDHGYDASEMASWVKRFDSAGERAALDIKVPKETHPCNNCDSGMSIVLYVPGDSSLKVDLSVGDVKVEGVRGDKDLHVGVGDLEIGYSNEEEYARIETSTHIGDIGDPLHPGSAHGFLGKSEDFTSQGRYHLRATVGVGDLNLFAEGKS
jgi:hypothetical protein